MFTLTDVYIILSHCLLLLASILLNAAKQIQSMNYLKFTRPFAGLLLLATFFSACKKNDLVDPVENNSGQSLVRIVNGGAPGIQKEAIDFVAEPVVIVAADIRRDVTGDDELNQPATVTVIDDTAAVRAAGLILLDPSWYAIDESTPKIGGDGGTFTLTFQPGEFAKAIKITIPDATVLDPNQTYGLGFTIQSSDKGKISSAKTLVVEIGAKNKYDGVYQLKGFHNRPTLTDPYDEEVHLITTGANTVKMYWPALGADAHPIHGGTTYYGSFTTAFTFDAETGALTSVVNPYNPPATVFTIGPATDSRYDEGTRTIYAQYYYSNNLERMFTDTLIYTGSR